MSGKSGFGHRQTDSILSRSDTEYYQESNGSCRPASPDQQDWKKILPTAKSAGLPPPKCRCATSGQGHRSGGPQSGHYRAETGGRGAAPVVRRLEKRVAERTAEISQERLLLRTLIDNLPDYVYIKDAEGRFVLANLAVARQMGFSSPMRLSENRISTSSRMNWRRDTAPKKRR